MKSALARHDTILRKCIESNGGYVFKTVGDAFCAAFVTAVEGMKAALDAQVALIAAPWEVPGGIRVRMGLHTGTAEERDGDYFGQTLNRAARLFSTGYGGQTLVSLVTAELLRDNLPDDVSLQDLGAHRLKDLLRPESIFQLVKAGLRSDFPALKSLDNHPHNLPLEPNPFVGREKELEAVQALLANQQVRVVTLTGIGGTGKTRLSLQAAANVVESFPDGVFFVDLSAIDSAAHVIPMIARTLELRETGARPLKEVLQDALRDKRMLLILDNFEQVMAGVPHVVDLLAGAPLLKLLVTSREALHIRAERVYIVPPLSVPKIRDARHMVTSHLTQYEAVTLFIERAIAVSPDFAVTNENAPAVAEICARLDGLPLAIELAAARLNILSPVAILDRLGNRLKLLSGGAADLPFRQRTLRATIDWSYRMLSPIEQALFKEAAVFSGGCTLEALEAVCSFFEQGGTDVVDIISSLVGKSMLSCEERQGSAPRFIMFESLREYGLELLSTGNATKAVRDAHARYFLQYAEKVEPLLTGPKQKFGFDALEADHDNLRAALDWFHETGDTESEMRLCVALGLYWQVRGHLSEGIELLKKAVASNGSTAMGSRAKVLLELGNLQFEKGEYDISAHDVRSALEIFKLQGERSAIAWCYDRLGWSAFKLNDFSRAGRFFAAVRAGRLSDDPYLRASAEKGLGCVAQMLGEFEESQTLLERSKAYFASNSNVFEHAKVLDDLASLCARRKNYLLALTYSLEALDLWKSIGDFSGVLVTYNNLGFSNLRAGNSAEARRNYELLLSTAIRAGNLRWQNLACSGVADASLLDGDDDAAAEYSFRAEKILGTSGWEMERGIVYRIKAEILRRAGRYKESVEFYKRSQDLLRMVKDVEDLEIADEGLAKAIEELRRSK